MQALDADLAHLAVSRSINLASRSGPCTADLVARRQVGKEVVLAVNTERRLAIGVQPQARTHRLLDADLLITGGMPGMAASTSDTWVFRIGAEHRRCAGKNGFGNDLSVGFSPRTISQSPVSPLVRALVGPVMT